MEIESLKSLIEQAPGIAAVIVAVVLFLKAMDKKDAHFLGHLREQGEQTRVFQWDLANKYGIALERTNEALDKNSNTLGSAMYAMKNGKDS